MDFYGSFYNIEDAEVKQKSNIATFQDGRRPWRCRTGIIYNNRKLQIKDNSLAPMPSYSLSTCFWNMSVKREVFAYHKKLMDNRVGKYFRNIIKIVLDMIRLKFSCKQMPTQDF